MEIKFERMPEQIKCVVTIDSEEVKRRKAETYEEIKHQIQVPGFRKGNVSMEVAEAKLSVEKLYTPMIDKICKEIVEKERNIVSTKDFKFFGDLKANDAMVIEFIAEMKPTVKTPNLNDIYKNIEKRSTQEVTEKELNEYISNVLKQNEIIHDSTKETLENFDIAIIDFTGFLEGQTTPFKGGTAKNFQITVNELVNGRKQFIDNFEDQMVGMKKGEKRNIHVTFPSDYNEKTLSGKKAVFEVTLNAIKYKEIPKLDDEFAKTLGFETFESYKEISKNEILANKKKSFETETKREILSKVISESEISPIPQNMIDNENDKEWNSLLRRLGKTAEQLQKESKVTKEMVFANSTARSIETLKASLVLEQLAKELNVSIDKKEVVEYALEISQMLGHGHDDEHREALTKKLDEDQRQFEFFKSAVANEKVLDFLVSSFLSAKE